MTKHFGIYTLCAVLSLLGIVAHTDTAYAAAVKAEMVQGAAPEHTYTPQDDGKMGRTTIRQLTPKNRATFESDSQDSIPVRWYAKNVPENSVVMVELQTLKMAPGWSVGGGTWQGEIPEGDSTGEYKWDIRGGAHTGAGVYRVRTLIRACHPDGCTQNPDFPKKGSVKVKTYAKTLWKTIKVTSLKG